jgi:hypothetical protein
MAVKVGVDQPLSDRDKRGWCLPSFRDSRKTGQIPMISADSRKGTAKVAVRSFRPDRATSKGRIPSLFHKVRPSKQNFPKLFGGGRG